MVNISWEISYLTDIINTPEEFQKKSLEQKSATKSRSKFSCEIVLEFQKINYY